MLHIVAGLVVVGVQAVAGNGLRYHALLGQGVIVGARKEFLFWMRIGDQMGAMGCQRRAQVGALPIP